MPRELLPAIVDTSGVVGETEPQLFGGPLPIAALCGDQQAALFGQGCVAAGQAKVTYGTGCFLLAHTGDGGRRLAPQGCCRRWPCSVTGGGRSPWRAAPSSAARPSAGCATDWA